MEVFDQNNQPKRLEKKSKCKSDSIGGVHRVPTSTRKNLRSIIEEEMKGVIVQSAIMLGFEEGLIYEVLKDKMKSGEIYESVRSLVDDLQDKEKNNRQKEPASSMPWESPSTSTLVSSTYTSSSPSSSTSSNGGDNEEMEISPEQSSLSSLPAGLVLMLDPSLPHSMNVDNYQRPEETRIEGNETEEGEFPQEEACKVCLDKRANCLFRPCSHLCCCERCAGFLRTCPICRTRIKEIYKIYRK